MTVIVGLCMMAAYPYVSTTNFGGYVTFKPSSNFGISVGAKSYYDPFARRTMVDPIIAPTVKIGKVKVGIDIGPVVKEGIRSLVGGHNKKGPHPINMH